MVKRILLVADGHDGTPQLVSSLKAQGYQIIVSPSGFDALEAAKDLNPHLILFDVSKPGDDGFFVCRKLRTDLARTPIVFISDRTLPGQAVKGFESGAWDYIQRPFDPEEVGARIKHVLWVNDTIEDLLDKAHHDPLTGLLNRRAMAARVEEEIARCVRESLPLSCLVFDLDHFKKINDTHGHTIGDEVLVELSTRLKLLSRTYDLVGRLGGEEFVLVLPNTTLPEAEIIGERIRQYLEEAPFMTSMGALSVTVSGGVSQHWLGAGFTELWDRADRGLYRAKAAGRNRIMSLEA